MRELSERVRRTRAPQAPALLAGRYVVLDQLGSGGMGAVYRARDQLTGQHVALKQLLTSLAGPRRRLVETMFEREYHTLVRLKHPRVIEVYDYGLSDSGPYYTMELLEGKDLQQLAPLPYKVACAHLRDVASLLALLCAQRLVHRDISPRNVRFGADGRAKLIDFGALHPFGPATDIVGTPPCMAPEVLSKTVLDQRTDLYALGAVAYYALTGRHAYPARRLPELPALWKSRPAPPSQSAPDIPPALDELVLSLLRVEPVSRPAHPAAVIDALSAIGDLPADEYEVAAEAYLLSGRLVGRKTEQDWLAQWLSRALSGRGGELLLDGPAGVGKTRLLQETALDAQLRGMAVLRADAQALPSQFGVATALSIQLLDACAEPALAAAKPHAELLGQLSGELHEKLGSPALVPLPTAAAERRALLQTALHDWFLGVAQEQPLLLAVDNLQAADDNSAAFLAGIGFEARKTKLLMVCAQRDGDEVQAPAPVRELRGRAAHLDLANLDLPGCIELVSSLFGDVANADRLAQLLHQRSAGNPQQLTDLCQLLIKKQIASYVAGTWVLPIEVADDELPRGAEALSESRLTGLSPAARTLLDAISVNDRPVSLELGLDLASSVGLLAHADVHAALSELLAHEVLVFEDDRYRFTRESLRQALLERMEPKLRADRHRQLAACLLGRPVEDLASQLHGARHLLDAGDEKRGAELLAGLGRRFVRARAVDESPDEVVQSLHAALRIFEREGRSPYALAEIMLPMLEIAYQTREWRLLLDYGEPMVELGAEIFGLRRARRLRRWLGPKLAFPVATLCAAVQFAFAPRGGRAWRFLEAFQLFLAALTAASGTLCLVSDVEALERIEREVEPLGWLGTQTPLAFALQFVERLSDLTHGRMLRPYLDFDAVTAWLNSPKMAKALGEEHRKIVYGGMLCGRAVSFAFRFGDGALTLATRAENVGVRMWAAGAAQARMLYHALRGESEQTQRYRAELELFAVRGGTTWQVELAMPTAFINVNALAADTIAVRQTSEQLMRRARTAPSMQVYADAAHAVYLSLRGQLPQALAMFERVIPQFRPYQRAAWPVVNAAYAQALNRSGQHARARALLRDVLANTNETEAEFVGVHLEVKRQLALAEAGLENRVEAAAMLDGLLEKHGAETNPLLIGLLHKARAEVALMAGDVERFEHHFAELQSRFHGTRNPALIAQCDRLLARARKAGLHMVTSAPPTTQADDVSSYFSLLDVVGSADPFAHVLSSIVHHARARRGYLYIFDHPGLRLVAATSSEEAPAGLETQLREHADHLHQPALQSPHAGSGTSDVRELDRTRIESRQPAPLPPGSVHDNPPAAAPGDDDEATAFVDPMTEAAPLSSYCVRPLQVRRNGELQMVGGLILEPDPERPLLIPSALLDAAAEVLHRRGTVLSN